MSGGTWVGAFLDSLAAERNAAVNTRIAYARDLNDFSAWLAHRGRELSDVSQRDVDAYLLSPVATDRDANVILHVAPGAIGGKIGPLLLAADLAEHRRPREDARAALFLQQIVRA